MKDKKRIKAYKKLVKKERKKQKKLLALARAQFCIINNLFNFKF